MKNLTSTELNFIIELLNNVSEQLELQSDFGSSRMVKKINVKLLDCLKKMR